MSRSRSRDLVLAIIVSAVAFAMPSPARAGFTLKLEETGFAAVTFNLTSGTLNTVGPFAFGDYQITVTARDSAPGIDPVFDGALVTDNVFVVTTNGSGAADLMITLQDDTFSGAGFGNPTTLQNSLSTTLITSGSVTAHAFLNAGTTANITLNGPTLSGSVSNSASVTGPGATFTLGNVATVNFSGTGVQQANFNVNTLAPQPQAVPAAAALVLVVAGLPILTLARRRRRREQM